MLNNIERQMKRRFVIGSQVSEHAIIQDFLRQVRTKLTCTYYSLDVKQLTLCLVVNKILYEFDWLSSWYCVYVEIPGACHLQGTSSDAEARGGAVPHAEEDALSRQVTPSTLTLWIRPSAFLLT